MGTFDQFVDAVMADTCQDVRDVMAQQAHVYSGDLQDNIAAAPVRKAGKRRWRVVVDPHHDGWDGTKDQHYAMMEAGRGGDHDFTRGNQENGEQAAAYSASIWRGAL